MGAKKPKKGKMQRKTAAAAAEATEVCELELTQQRRMAESAAKIAELGLQDTADALEVAFKKVRSCRSSHPGLKQSV